MAYYTLGILIVMCSAVGAWQVLGGSVKEEEKWVEPNAWAKEVEAFAVDSGFCTCNAKGNTGDVSGNNQAAVIVLKKFLRQLFIREKLEYDKQFSLYQRSLLFTISAAQLEKLEQLEDPRDLDSVLMEIIENLRTPNDYNKKSGSWSNIFALIWDIFKDCVLLLRFSEVRFITFVVLTIIAGWFIHRKHKISIIVIIFGGIFIFGYFHTYLECNRELEMKQMIEAIEHSDHVPEPYQPRWYTPITSWFGSSKEETAKQERRKKVKRESRLNLSFCRPDHVLLMYMNDIFMKQLEFLIEKCFVTIARVRENLGFPYNYMAVACVLFLIVMLIKLSFEHVLSPRVWTGYFQRNNAPAAGSMHQHALPQNNEDRISGENLKNLLKVLSIPKENLATITRPAISCVQEVLESLEAPKVHNESQNSSSSSSLNSYTSVKNNSDESKADLSDSACSISASIVEAVLEQETSTISENQNDADFVMVSEVKSKVLLEDLINDFD